MYNLKLFTMNQMMECGAALRRLGTGARSMEEVANKIVRYLYEHLTDPQTGEKSCALVRFYTTHPYGELPADLREFARALLGEHPELPSIQCLTLLATAGDKPEWTSRANSVGHKAIPLPSEKVVAQIPMIAQLIKQLGLEISEVVKPDPSLIADQVKRTYNAFYISEAVGSPYIPAQAEFVIPFGIKSALGFGGRLPASYLFAIIMFSKVHIPEQTADMFGAVARSAAVAVEPFAGGTVFA